MHQYATLNIAPLSLLVALIGFGATDEVHVQAADAIASAGDILQYVIPGTAAGFTLAYRDWEGSLQFGESIALTAGLTFGLKYSVNERRPNGGTQSFPS